MKLKYFITLIALLTAGAIIYSVRSQTTPTQFRSFIATSVMSAPIQNSSYPYTQISFRAVREDGSYVMIGTTVRNSLTPNERDIKDFKRGEYIVVEDATKSVVRSSLQTDVHFSDRLAPAVSCEGTPAGQILGFNVNYTEIKRPTTDPKNGEINSLIKSWATPDLGCFVLQKETIMTRVSDGALLTDTKITPISVSFQPVDQLFDVPTSYTERTKEEVLEQINQLNQLGQ